MKKNSIYVFTYGTLKKGFLNHFILDGSRFISSAGTFEKYQMYPCINFEFPFLIKSEKVNYIKGEVFEVSLPEVLRKLDLLEGYPDLYLKEFIDIRLEDGSIVSALTYFKNEDTNKNIMELTFPITEWLKDFASNEFEDEV